MLLTTLPEVLLREILLFLLAGHATTQDEHDALDDIVNAAVCCRVMRRQADAIFDERLKRSTEEQRDVAYAWRLAGFRLLQICDAGSSYADPVQLRALTRPHMRWVAGMSPAGYKRGEPPVVMDANILAQVIGEVHPVLFEWNRVGRKNEEQTWSSAKCPIVMTGATKTYLDRSSFSLAVIGILQQWMPDLPTAFGGMQNLCVFGKALLRKHANNIDEASTELAWRADQRGCVVRRRKRRDRQFVSCTGECTIPRAR